MRSLLRDRRSAQGGSCNTAETEQRRGARPRVARVVRGRTDRSMRSKYAFSPAAVRPAVFLLPPWWCVRDCLYVAVL